MKILSTEQLVKARTEELFKNILLPDGLDFFKPGKEALVINEALDGSIIFELFDGVLPEHRADWIIVPLDGKVLYRHIEDHMKRIDHNDLMITLTQDRDKMIIHPLSQGLIIDNRGYLEEIAQLEMYILWE